MSANINKENAGIIKNDTILCHTSPYVVAQNIGWVQILIRKMLGPPKMTTLCHNSINKVFNLDEQIILMSQVQSFIDLVWNENRNISTCFIMKIMGLMKKITPLSFFAWFKWAFECEKPATVEGLSIYKSQRDLLRLCMRNPRVLLTIWCSWTSPPLSFFTWFWLEL